MKIETLEKDLRNVDEIVIKTGEFVNGNNAEIVSAPRAALFYVYWLAVAVWHILDWILKKEKNNDQFQKPYEVMRATALAPTIIEAEEGE